MGQINITLLVASAAEPKHVVVDQGTTLRQIVEQHGPVDAASMVITHNLKPFVAGSTVLQDRDTVGIDSPNRKGA